MSKTVTITIWGVSNKVTNIPENNEEYTTLAGGDALAAHTNALRGDLDAWKAKFKIAVSKALHENGFPRQSEEKDGKTAFTESEKTHFDRVVGDNLKEHEALFDRVVSETPFKVIGSDLGQVWLDRAAELLEKMKAKENGCSYFVANMTAKNPSVAIEFEEDGTTPTTNSVAVALKTDRARKDKEEEDEHLAPPE